MPSHCHHQYHYHKNENTSSTVKMFWVLVGIYVGILLKQRYSIPEVLTPSGIWARLRNCERESRNDSGRTRGEERRAIPSTPWGWRDLLLRGGEEEEERRRQEEEEKTRQEEENKRKEEAERKKKEAEEEEKKQKELEASVMREILVRLRNLETIVGNQQSPN